MIPATLSRATKGKGWHIVWVTLVGLMLSSAGFAQGLEARYAKEMAGLKDALTKSIPAADKLKGDKLDKFLASDALDAKLVKYVVLKEATPKGLAEFAARGKEQRELVEKLLEDPKLMKQMLVADGAKNGQYGPAMKIYSDIQKASKNASGGVLQRLAVAIALEHAVPISQRNPKALANAPETVDPVKRYRHYEKAYEEGELDSVFKNLTTWDLRFVVNGNEPNKTLAWGRMMLRNYRPDHIFKDSYGWKYVGIVGSDVKYGSGDVKHDLPELQFFQNILMNGGVCGRRAFFGRFILRSFGIPTTARPSRGHAALAHWTPKGWVVNLGGGWGAGWTKTVYKNDKDFLASTQARMSSEAYLKVKRAMWVGDVMGEKRTYGESAGKPAFWNGVSLKTQSKIIEESKAQTLAALGAEIGESNEQPTEAQKVMASPVTPADKKISYGKDGRILIPAAAYTKPSNNTRDVIAMKSFAGGLQVFLPRFSPKGVTIMRGGAWRGGADSCRSGWRMPSSGYGRYNNWGFRAAMSATGSNPPSEVKLDLGDGLTMEFVYIKPGTFIMGGENSTNRKWHGTETPKHEVTLTKGYYMGKYEVTQAQFKKIMGRNPSTANKDPNAPADTISAGDAAAFCNKLAEKAGKPTRLPTEAEWEYACRAGTTTKYFFGDDPSKLGDYAWYNKNDGGKSHPVGRKQPNPWGLYDILGNVCERVSDKYDKNYYANSPKENPTGPRQGTKSNMEYEVDVAQGGEYALSALVVTPKHSQKLYVSANGSEAVMEMPFTVGAWQECEPVTIKLKQGMNRLKFLRRDPPQHGMAIKSFELKPLM